MEEEEGNQNGVRFSEFDYSIENHFKAIDTISKLCGKSENGDVSENAEEFRRLSSSITFLREWKDFMYTPRDVRFSRETKSPPGRDVVDGVSLTQFSAATVPKERQSNTASLESRKDFVLYVGGPVWALDWCPILHQRCDSHVKCEFIAVSAHPPGSSYHKLGAPLTGRGAIQIWCLLDVDLNEEKGLLQVDGMNQEKKPKGRPRKKQIIESSNDLDCSAQFTDALIIGEERKDKLAQQKRPRGRPRKEPEEESTQSKKPRSRLRKKPKEESIQPKKPRGRPRKKPIAESFYGSDHSDESIQALAVQIPEESSSPTLNDFLKGKLSKLKNQTLSKLENPKKISTKKPLTETQHDFDCNQESIHALAVEFPEVAGQVPLVNNAVKDESAKLKKLKARCKRKPLRESLSDIDSNNEPSQALVVQLPEYSCQVPALDELGQDESSLSKKSKDGPEKNLTAEYLSNEPFEMKNDSTSYPLPNDVGLPRMVLCLAHNGRVAWDVKWQPIARDSESKHRMGYLAVLLGNGSLEVWEVPFPSTVKDIFASSHTEGSDPRFVKLRPVFRCSKLKCGDRESIPLTLEWSASVPHDFILAGCHDGTVALWKFCAGDFLKDTRPLLCFSADAVPIRALAWAPVEDDPESANVIVTAGHGGVKFWDIRDPFRPLWDLSSLQRIVYSLDWFPDPRCIILSLDDGTLKMLNLAEGSYDVPVTGKPYAGTKFKGMQTYCGSSFAIWSVQVSRLTGMVAYCSADGAVVRFQLKSKAWSNDRASNRSRHFLLSSITEEKGVLTVNTPLPNTPVIVKKPRDVPTSLRALSDLNQASANSSKAKIQTSDDTPLALCYGNDTGEEFGMVTVSDDPKMKCKLQAKSSNKKRPKHDLVCVEEEVDDTEEKENKKCIVENDVEVLPPHVAAMHRVRWNMNKGSERWLCYGGAAGIVRCQEIVFSDLDKNIQKKWNM